MDLNDYWQENKRFVTTVAAGFIAFLIGIEVVDSMYGKDLRKKQGAIVRSRSELAKPKYGTSDLATARNTNEAVSTATDQLAQQVVFEARSRFELDPARGSANNQYFETVSGVREELLVQARRRNLRVPEDLGLPGLSPTRELLIQRYLEALDVIDRVVHMSMVTGVGRIDKITITTDPGLESSRGIGALEQTEVTFRMNGLSLALMRFFALSQDADNEYGAPLLVHTFEMKPEKQKPDEAWLEVTFLVVRMHGESS